MRLRKLTGMMAGFGVGVLVCGQAAAITQDDPLQGQVWEVVIASDAAAYRKSVTIEFRFENNCIAMSSSEEDVQYDPCASQFALTSAGEEGFTYAFSYDFPFSYIYPVQTGFSSSTMEATGHAQGDADCAGFDLMEVGETRSEICGLPELTVEQDYSNPYYSSITRTQ